MSVVKKIVVHPLVFALYPALALLAHNVHEVPFKDAHRSLLYSFIGALVLFVIFRVLLRDVYRAGLASTLFLFVFFSYGHIYHGIKDIPQIGQTIGHHRYALILCAGAFFLGLWWLIKTTKDLVFTNQVFNLIGLLLLVYPLIQIVGEARLEAQGEETASILLSQAQPLEPPQGGRHPDIYYIILDTYTRADSLQGYFDFDNSSFLNSLRDLGFYVAECSRCNHSGTQGSLISSLNLDYLQTLHENLESVGENTDLTGLLRHSLVRGQLEAIGYKTIAFESGFEWSTIRDADVLLGLKQPSIVSQLTNEFEMMLIRNSMGLIYMDLEYMRFRDRKQSFYDPLDQIPFGQFAKREYFILENLPQVVSIPGLKWVFVHIIIPHQPRIFTPEGDIVDDPGYYMGPGAGPINGEYEIKGYTNGIQFINSQILIIVEDILRQSNTPPIIVIQGDTGGPGPTKYNILNAYYFKGETNPGVYEHITPVNTFRLIFDSYFGSNYGLLPDLTYNVDMELVPERSPACTR